MNKAEIYNYLNEHGISYECTEHPAVYNMEELDALELPYPEWDAKNLFVRDDKKKNFYLITVRGEKRVDLKEFRKAHGLRNLSFASAEDLFDRRTGGKYGRQFPYLSLKNPPCYADGCNP